MDSMRRRDILKAAGLGSAALVLPGWARSLLAADTQPAAHKTDWMHQGKWGVMFHFCSNWFKMGENWEAIIRDFKAAELAKQLDQVGAGWFCITAKHCGTPIAPNAAFEAKNPGKIAKRDLIADLSAELSKYDIKLMLYYATGMGIPPIPQNAEATAAVIKEYSLRYGRKVSGWWLDNNTGQENLQQIIADAVRAGNADSLVAFSSKAPKRASKFDDYTAGNTHAPGSARCGGRFVQGAQWHILTYVGNNWAGYCKNPNPRFDAARASGMTAGICSRGGAVTWDTPYETTGLIREAYLPVLKAIGDATGTIKARADRRKTAG